jgi:hypothetical protein
MSNRDNYKKAFSALQTSCDFSLEDEKMAILKRKAVIKNVVAAAAICLAVIALSGTAYAANVGGIQRIIQLWIHGDQTTATIEFDGAGNYTMEYTDEDGNIRESGGGGIAIEPDGTERPLTEEELLADLVNDVDVEYYDDGRVILYFMDQVVDITDKFEDGYCYVFLDGEDEDLYVTVKYQDGWSISPDKYTEY